MCALRNASAATSSRSTRLPGTIEIEQEIMRAKESLRNQVADLAVAGAAKILKREVDAKAHADLLAAIRQQL